MRIDWLPAAQRDRTSQLAYIAKRNPRAALEIGDVIDTTVLRLIDHPYSGRKGRVGRTRELVVTKTPFVVIYRVADAAIVILRVLHGAQQWPRTP